jgi:hypothetical protein
MCKLNMAPSLVIVENSSQFGWAQNSSIMESSFSIHIH